MTTEAAEHLLLADFDYHLPEALIAQEPLPVRDQSRLLVLGRTSGRIEHHRFGDIVNLLRDGDLLIVNNTKVFPCRLPARKPGGGKAEVFLLKEQGVNVWEALVKAPPARGKRLVIAEDVEAEVLSQGDDGLSTVRFHGTGNIRELLPSLGKTPLPPYIKRELRPGDQERYQTVFASQPGAVAAPTAGLHFTGGLIESLKQQGVQMASVTLHVGPGTFLPVRCERVAEHRMFSESYEVPQETAEAINLARSEGRRVIAVGTTSVRTIETAAVPDGRIAAVSGSSSLYIYPGFSFRVTEGLITNFHLPRSTLLLLVSAFAGRESVLAAYQEAVAREYRFFSYGDAMFIS